MLLQTFGRKGSSAALFFAAVAGLASSARADTVLDTGTSYIWTSYDNHAGSSDIKKTNITSLPSAGTDSVSGGGNSASTTYSFTATAFDTSFIHSRTGTTLESNAVSQSHLLFTVNDATTSYDMSGSYTFSSPYAGLEIELFDLTANADVFASNNETDNSLSHPGGTFTVGGSEGQTATSKTLPFSGTLLAGHHYLYSQSAEIEAFPNADTGATASGSLALTFTDSADLPATPLPTTASAGLGLMACLGLLHLARRRRPQLVRSHPSP